MNGYEELATSIILQACQDYIQSSKKLKKQLTDKEKRQTEKMRKDCIKFFNSDYFTLLSPISSERILKKLDEIIANNGRLGKGI